jgi:hypothetical protein
MNNAEPTPIVLSRRPVKSSCRSSDISPATMLKVPKNMASSSVLGTEALAIALNCHPAIVVVTAEMAISHAIAFRYGDSRISRRLAHNGKRSRTLPDAGVSLPT